jgi:hypothetical protein
MPSAIVADGSASAHSSSSRDTRAFNSPEVIATLVAEAQGLQGLLTADQIAEDAAKRKYASGDLVHLAASFIPALAVGERQGHTSWVEVVSGETAEMRTWSRPAGTFGSGDPSTPLMYLEQPDFQLQDSGHVLEGAEWNISVSPGRVRVWTRDRAREHRTQQRAVETRLNTADAAATYLVQRHDGKADCVCKRRARWSVASDLGQPGDVRRYSTCGRAECDPENSFDRRWIRFDDLVPQGKPSRQVTCWSQKSRANMVGSFADLELAPMFADPLRPACMVTFTYPRCWLAVAPTGREVKKHLKKWRKRFERKFGPIMSLWKLEFQGRHPGKRCEHCGELDDGRAPHIHMLLCPPNHDVDGTAISSFEFKAWLSESWTASVDHPDPEQRAAHLRAGTNIDYREGRKASDPRRVITYFAKHSGAEAKEYQHFVPDAWRSPGKGPGRFWGHWGLDKCVVTVPVSPEIGMEAGRILRRHSRAQQVTRLTQRRRYRHGRADSKYPEVIGVAGAQLMEAHGMTRKTASGLRWVDRVPSRRPCRTRAVRALNGRGWSLVNDGANMGELVGRALQAAIEHHQAVPGPGYGSLLARAQRLPAGPRRDALLAKLDSANG